MSIQNIVEKHQEALKDLIDEIIDECIKLFEDRIPEELMKSPVGTMVVYNIALNLLCRLARVGELRSLQDLQMDISQIYNGLINQEEPLDKDQVN